MIIKVKEKKSHFEMHKIVTRCLKRSEEGKKTPIINLYLCVSVPLWLIPVCS